MDGRTAAAVLGVTERADHDTVRAAFRARAKVAHPDLGGDPEAFRRTLAAFDVLCRRRPADVVATPVLVGALAATHGFDGYDAPRPMRPAGTRRTFADELRVAMAREAAAAHR